MDKGLVIVNQEFTDWILDFSGICWMRLLDLLSDWKPLEWYLAAKTKIKCCEMSFVVSRSVKLWVQFNPLPMGESFQDYSWIQDFEAVFP